MLGNLPLLVIETAIGIIALQALAITIDVLTVCTVGTVVENATNPAGSLSLAPNGTRTSYLEAEITNAGSDTMTSLQLSANGYTILFQDLSVPAGGKLEIGYDDLHLMYAIVGSTHVLGKRTGQSADHIYLTPMRSNLISYTASHPVSVIFKARGVYE